MNPMFNMVDPEWPLEKCLRQFKNCFVLGKWKELNYYVDLVNNYVKSGNAEIQTLITSKDAFTLRAYVGVVSVLIEYTYDDETNSLAAGCTFDNPYCCYSDDHSVTIQNFEGGYDDYKDKDKRQKINDKLWEIFD